MFQSLFLVVALSQVEIRCTEGTVVNATVLDAALELELTYGTVKVQLVDVRRIELAPRFLAGDLRVVEESIRRLGDPDYKTRTDASAVLLRFGPPVYPYLLAALHTHREDTEAYRRVSDLLVRIRERHPTKRLRSDLFDRLWTDTPECLLAGRVRGESIRIHSIPFGEQKLLLRHICEISRPAAAEAPRLLDDPGQAANFQDGALLHVRVVGTQLGAVYGTGTYTVDTPIAAAATHAGLVPCGQAGVVQVLLVGVVPAFRGSPANGINSSSYGVWRGYRVTRVGDVP